ncbi:MAG TPA: lipopolysaccharide biosynthesis protein [Bryobacteraceae bacterium]|nr:lipopolysaccharide biosynthesis protein [Bryobacteraceae bacterium]
MHSPALNTLSNKIRSAYLWTTALQLTKNILGFGISILLAHFLEPGDYGLVGMVTVLIGMVSVIQDWGMGQAVVYFEDDPSHLPTYFNLTTATGIVLTVVTFFSAPVIAAFYNEPRLVVLVRVLSFTLLLGSLRAVPSGLLTKRFQFRTLTLAEGGCTLTAGLIAVGLAWKGFGVWSLVTNILLGALLQTILFCSMLRPRFSLHMDGQLLKKVLHWGLPYTGATLLWQFYDNADYLIIGKLLGSAPLGLYTLGFRLATVANDKISSVINRVTFPSFSAMQDDLQAVSSHWLSVTHKLALLNFPLLCALAVNAEDFISLVLGPKWLPAVPIVQLLCVVSALKSLTSITINLACARGRTDMNFQFTLANALLLPGSFALGCKLGSLVGVGIAWCLVFPFICAWLIWKVGRLVGIGFGRYCASLASPSLVGALCLAAMLPVSWLLPGGLLRLCVRSSIGLVCFIACIYSRQDLRDAVRALVGEKTPVAVGAVRT